MPETMDIDKEVLTVATVNYNTSDFIKVMLFALKMLTKNKHRVIICDNGSNLYDRMRLKGIAKAYNNVEIIFRKQSASGNTGHGEALNYLISLIKTPIGVILDSDAVFLKKGWDEILIASLNGRTAVIGAPPLSGSMKPTDFPSIYAVLFDTSVFKSLEIDMRPRDYKRGQDTGFEMRDKFLQNKYAGKVFETRSTRVYKNGPFRDVICAEYYFDNIGSVFASHFGRGASLGAEKYTPQNRLLCLRGIDIIARRTRGFIEKRLWLKTSKKIIIKEANKTDNRSVMWADAFWVGLGQAVTVPLGILTTAIIARFLSLKEFGTYQLVLSYIGAAKIATLPGMAVSLMKGAIKGYDRFFYKVLKLSFYTSLLGSVAFFLGGAYVLFFRNEGTQTGFLFIAAGIIFPIFTLEKASAVLVGKRDFKRSRQWLIMSSLLSLVAIGLTAYFSKSLVCIFIANCLVQIITLALLFFIVKRQLHNMDEDKGTENKLFKFGWKMTFIEAFGFVVTKVDSIIIGIINPALLAVYHVGARIPETVRMNSRTFLSIPTVHWAALDKKENVGKLIRYWWLFLMIGASASLLIWLLSPWFIVTFFGERYRDSIFVCRWLSIGIAPLLLRNVISNIDLFQGEGRIFRRIVVSTQAVYIILLALLIRYRIVGIVISVLSAEFILFFAFIGYFIYLSRRLKISPKAIL